MPRRALIGLVGESGSGKTTASLAARLTRGAVVLGETDILALRPEAMRALGGRRMLRTGDAVPHPVVDIRAFPHG